MLQKPFAALTIRDRSSHTRRYPGSVLWQPLPGGIFPHRIDPVLRRRGAQCVGLCGADKADDVKAVGPLAVIDRNCSDLGSALRDAIGKESVDVVADVVGGSLWPQLISALVRGGRYTCAGAIAGPMAEFDLRTFYLRDPTFTGATVPLPGVFEDLVGYIERDEIRPLLAATYPLENFHAAQQAFIDKRHVGNIVTEPFPPRP